MPWYLCLAIVGVVYGISKIRRTDLQALAYSAPIPITLALLAGDQKVTSLNLLGVLGLVLFFFVVAAANHVLPILLAVLVGILFYVGFALAVGPLPRLEFWPTLALLLLAWAIGASLVWAQRAPAPPPRKPSPVSWRTESGQIALLTLSTFSMVWLVGLIGNLSVTFPYSGTLVSAQLGDRILDFARTFVLTSVNLLAFFAGFAVLQDSVSPPLRYVAGWTAFIIVGVASRFLVRRARAR